jgi:hypothetical protein
VSTFFHIKAGNLAPSLVADLSDSNGNPVDFTGATVTFRMTDANGVPVINGASAEVVGSVPGRVRYNWAAGDTDVEGDYSAEFIVTASGVEQSFPTTNFTRVQVVPNVEAVTGISLDKMDRLRRMTDEFDTTTISAIDLADYINARNGDLNAAAYDIWMEKAATYAKLVNVSEAGSSRSLGDLHEQALTMAERYGKSSALIAVGVVKPTARTRPIVRP